MKGFFVCFPVLWIAAALAFTLWLMATAASIEKKERERRGEDAPTDDEV